MNATRMSISAFFAAFISIFFKLDRGLQALVMLMVMDYVSGVINAMKDKSVSSSVGFLGIFKKLMIGLVVCACAAMDHYLKVDVLANISICFYIANEAISILENAAKLGIPVPDKVKDMLAQIKSESEEGGFDNGLGTSKPDSSSKPG